MFVTVPDSSVTVCDYLYPGEGAEDCVNNVREIFGWQLEEDSVEDDLSLIQRVILFLQIFIIA